MNEQKAVQKTLIASFIGYIVQAIVNNFAPLLFLTFRSEFGISLDRVALLVTFNFGIQLLVDLFASRFVERIGYRRCVVTAHLFAGIGLIGLTVLPGWFGDPFIGLLLAVILYGIGGGLIEVLISPIVEACPTRNKAAVMSLLHSFYCWGQVGVVALSTAFFAVFGIASWRVIAVVWAAVSIANGVFFTRVPLRTLEENATEKTGVAQLVRRKTFWMMMLLMFAAGACELSISQWASAFAESALGVSKTVGDLAGPCVFAILMGLSRVIYARASERLALPRVMFGCGALCFAGYLLAALGQTPGVGLLGCALCGFSVGVMWPGTYSMAARELPGGGTAMFALLALGGDLGCSAGPTMVGLVSGAYGDQLKAGLLVAAVFPLLLMFGLLLRAFHARKQTE